MIRAFFALSVSALLERQLSLCADQLARQLGRQPLRWIAAENYHITLAFLGDIRPQDVPRLETIMSDMASQYRPCELQLREAIWFPSIHKPRLLVVDISPSKPLMNLQQRLSRQLRAAGFTVDSRRFRPHISLARADLGQQPKSFTVMTSDLTADMDELVLFQSMPHPSGSRYQPIAAELLTGL